MENRLTQAYSLRIVRPLLLKNFAFTNYNIDAAEPGLVEYTGNWKFNDVNISIDKITKTPEGDSSKEQNERLKN